LEDLVLGKPILRKGLKVRFEGTGAIIFVPQKGKTYELNSTATSVIKLCDGNNTFRGIVGAICKGYEDTEERMVEKDLNEILRELEQLGIVTWKNE